MISVRTRFAPSPTGFMHLGNVWIAFWNWLWTRQRKGRIVLRIEDIDRQRCKTEYMQALTEDLEWLGLDWDEGPNQRHAYGSVRQSDRMASYEKILSLWKQMNFIYPCYCSRARLQEIVSAPHEGEGKAIYDGRCRQLPEGEQRAMTKMPSWRVKVERQRISYDDFFSGEKIGDLYPARDDFVVKRADGAIAYQLACAADDGSMAITHVLRGYDLSDSSFYQIFLSRKLGYAIPQYGHLPLLVDKYGVRLSKRQGGITIRALRESGWRPEDIWGRMLYWAGGIKCFEKMKLDMILKNISMEDCPDLSASRIIVFS